MAIFSSWFWLCFTFFYSSFPFILYSTAVFLYGFSVLSFSSSILLLRLHCCLSSYSSFRLYLSYLKKNLFSSFFGLPNSVYLHQVTWMRPVKFIFMSDQYTLHLPYPILQQDHTTSCSFVFYDIHCYLSQIFHLHKFLHCFLNFFCLIMLPWNFSLPHVKAFKFTLSISIVTASNVSEN